MGDLSRLVINGTCICWASLHLVQPAAKTMPLQFWPNAHQRDPPPPSNLLQLPSILDDSYNLYDQALQERATEVDAQAAAVVAAIQQVRLQQRRC